jgi:hypothetical protein
MKKVKHNFQKFFVLQLIGRYLTVYKSYYNFYMKKVKPKFQTFFCPAINWTLLDCLQGVL